MDRSVGKVFFMVPLTAAEKNRILQERSKKLKEKLLGKTKERFLAWDGGTGKRWLAWDGWHGREAEERERFERAMMYWQDKPPKGYGYYRPRELVPYLEMCKCRWTGKIPKRNDGTDRYR